MKNGAILLISVLFVLSAATQVNAEDGFFSKFFKKKEAAKSTEKTTSEKSKQSGPIKKEAEKKAVKTGAVSNAGGVTGTAGTAGTAGVAGPTGGTGGVGGPSRAAAVNVRPVQLPPRPNYTAQVPKTPQAPSTNRNISQVKRPTHIPRRPERLARPQASATATPGGAGTAAVAKEQGRFNIQQEKEELEKKKKEAGGAKKGQ